MRLGVVLLKAEVWCRWPDGWYLKSYDDEISVPSIDAYCFIFFRTKTEGYANTTCVRSTAFITNTL